MAFLAIRQVVVPTSASHIWVIIYVTKRPEKTSLNFHSWWLCLTGL